jgi:hypothetical protein
MQATDRLDEQTVADVIAEVGRDVAMASTHPWATAADIRMTQRLIADIGVLGRIVNERVPHTYVVQTARLYLLAGVTLGALTSAAAWWSVMT